MNLFHLFIKIQHSTANPTLSISTISPSTIELSDEDKNLELYIDTSGKNSSRGLGPIFEQ